MITVFLKILAIFLMIATGYAANRTGILPSESNKYLVNLLLKITTPCMILGSIGEKELENDTVSQVLQILAGSAVFFTVIAIFSFLCVKAMRYKPETDQGIMMVIITACNTGFMGFPIVKAIFGDEYFFLMVIENIVLNLYIFCFSIPIMNYKNRTDKSPKDTIKSALNLCTITSLLGLAILFLQVPMPDFYLDFLNSVGDATIPLSMIIVGIQLADSDLKSMLRNTKLFIAAFINVAVVPLMAFLAIKNLPLDESVKITMIFASCLPCAVAATGVAAEENLNASLMSEGIALTTALSIITLPIGATYLLHYFNL